MNYQIYTGVGTFQLALLGTFQLALTHAYQACLLVQPVNTGELFFEENRPLKRLLAETMLEKVALEDVVRNKL